MSLSDGQHQWGFDVDLGPSGSLTTLICTALHCIALLQMNVNDMFLKISACLIIQFHPIPDCRDSSISISGTLPNAEPHPETWNPGTCWAAKLSFDMFWFDLCDGISTEASKASLFGTIYIAGRLLAWNVPPCPTHPLAALAWHTGHFNSLHAGCCGWVYDGLRMSKECHSSPGRRWCHNHLSFLEALWASAPIRWIVGAWTPQKWLAKCVSEMRLAWSWMVLVCLILSSCSGVRCCEVGCRSYRNVGLGDSLCFLWHFCC